MNTIRLALIGPPGKGKGLILTALAKHLRRNGFEITPCSFDRKVQGDYFLDIEIVSPSQVRRYHTLYADNSDEIS